jgi:N-acyl-D-amino-acid deacylase
VKGKQDSPTCRAADCLIRNVLIVDGTGRTAFPGAVTLAGDRIQEVIEGPSADSLSAREVVEGAGCVLSPGFIDVHTHDDSVILERPAMTPKVTQGVTSVITGNCGISLAPLAPKGSPPPPLDLLGDRHSYRFPAFADFAGAVEDNPPAVNAALLLGHSTLRVGAMAELDRPANGREIDRMQRQVADALTAGAVGLSSGLYYPPAAAAPKAEMIALLEVMAGSGAVYTTHMRDEGDHILESMEESFETAERHGVRLILSHHKCRGKENFGRSAETLARFEEARSRQDVGLDAYPYVAASTVLLPEMIGYAARVIVTWSDAEPSVAGRDLADIAAAWGCDEAAAVQRLQPAGAIYFSMDEADVRRILAYPHTMIGSDGLPKDRHPHPRLWGTFPRVLGHYVREVGLMPLEAAVHRMTGLPAERFGLSGRGVIRPGAFADLVLFDQARIIDRATFEAPTRPAAGISGVWVNGRRVLDEQGETGCRPGRLLRRA